MVLLRALMPGDSEMADRMRGLDWSGTGFGEPARWPPGLRDALRLCLTSPLPVFLGWGPDFSLLYNDACIPLLGAARHPAALGQPARHSLPELWEQIGPTFERAVASGEGQPPLLLSLGQAVTLCCSPILADDGRTVDGVFCPCSVPVEGARQLQADLARVTRATTLDGLAASIAHEVNQPLAAIAASASACLHWLAATPPNLAEAVAAASQIVRDATRAGDIILRIRKFVQRGAETSEDLDLAAIVAEVASMVQTELQMRKTVLRVIAPAGLPRVRGDRVQLQQVVLNLLVNAMEAMADVDEGKRQVEIDIRSVGDAEIVVAVKDTGVGLPAAQGERIFEAFFTTKPTGTGMGLTISRSIIEAHEGRLWAGSNEGPGATVSFRLPVSAPKTGP